MFFNYLSRLRQEDYDKTPKIHEEEEKEKNKEEREKTPMQ